jgi:hypothetical protein
VAFDMRTDRRSATNKSPETAMFEDLTQIHAALAGHCFAHLQAWQRIFARYTLALTAMAVTTHVCAKREPDENVSTAGAAKQQIPDARESLHDMIQKSYEHDVASQKARVALRPVVPEANDRYFEVAECDESVEYLPGLVRFREHSAFKLQRV